MLSGNEHSHDERLTADDADGKAGFLAGVGLKSIRENKKTPIGDELSGNGAKRLHLLSGHRPPAYRQRGRNN